MSWFVQHMNSQGPFIDTLPIFNKTCDSWKRLLSHISSFGKNNVILIYTFMSWSYIGPKKGLFFIHLLDKRMFVLGFIMNIIWGSLFYQLHSASRVIMNDDGLATPVNNYWIAKCLCLTKAQCSLFWHKRCNLPWCHICNIIPCM